MRLKNKEEIIDYINSAICSYQDGFCDTCPLHNEKKQEYCDVERLLRIVSTPKISISPKKWVDNMIGMMTDDKQCDFILKKPFTFMYDRKTKKSVVAICSEEDEYFDRIGIAIAYARLRGLSVHPAYASKKDKVLGEDE